MERTGSAADFDEVVELARGLCEDTAFSTVAAWKDRGEDARAIGAFPVYVPTELIEASGALPVSLFGGGGIEISQADSRIQSFVCSIARSTLELGLTGALPFLDGLVFPSICDVARNLSGVWKRNFPDTMVEFIHLPQNRDSPAAIPYATAEYRRLLASLEKATGHAISDEDVRRAIERHNENRRAVAALVDRRCREPWRIDAWESYLLLRAGGVLPTEDHTRLLQRALAAVDGRDRKKRDKVKVVLRGAFCEQPPLELIQAIEEAGCYILDDDFLLGRRWFGGPVSPDGDPVASLARGYVLDSPASSVSHFRGTPKQDAFPDLCRDLGAEGVIFCTAKFCEPALYDLVLYTDRLEKGNVPYVHLEFEEKMSEFERARTQVETFVETILFE